ncbi:MAG: mannose-1-phosphate guanylyltransferase/mannose-6-phosphate isomerase [Gammaproteobacteria bacterium]|nr:MAG: mannose-1-phosphate guanylyltransferase/mannose-6-phosphate isomerase [Gammaproteobacteria bacterium]RLA45862.1 MAG: mannose-1-phosphate guanylyltransferase/mannose-6-phosphate isomerase [Gammaproteobacteria bacterium]
MIPVVLSGGSGSRLWPLSRAHYPKQFIPLASERTMLQETLGRLQGLCFEALAPLVICNEQHRFMVAEQLREIDVLAQNILLEPVGRNTAPAVALAALSVAPDDILLVLPADHVINDVNAFHAAIELACSEAEQGALVTFGVVPTAAQTGYGYIHAASTDGTTPAEGLVARRIEKFIEKPDLATAQAYVDSGDYYWNSGMFAFKASRYLEELERHHPAMLNACRAALDGASVDLDFTRLDEEAFSACPADSIDYAVMEKTDRAVMIPLDAGWSDIGSWSALWDISDKDDQGNTCIGDVLTVDTHDSYLHTSGRLLATVGIRDLVVVETDDAVLVADKSHVQDVKEVVNQLQAAARSERESHRKVYRPWGFYDSIAMNDRYQAKRIVVNPGARLSLQKHHHRAEHWVVVQGTGRVTRGDEEVILSVNESIYIPIGMAHRLENPGIIPLEIIEVQTGDYLGEDDIVRLDDQYGRVDDTPTS